MATLVIQVKFFFEFVNHLLWIISDSQISGLISLFSKTLMLCSIYCVDVKVNRVLMELLTFP